MSAKHDLMEMNCVTVEQVSKFRTEVLRVVSELERQLAASEEARKKAEAELVGLQCKYDLMKFTAEVNLKACEAAEARIKASQEQEPAWWVHEDKHGRASFINMPFNIPDEIALYKQPIIPPEVAELQRENAELKRKLAEQQALSVSILGRLRCYSFDDAESFVTSDGTKELTKLIEEAKRQAVPEWQPIETAPKDGTRVLIVNDNYEIDAALYVEEWSDKQEFVRTAKDGDVFRTVREDIGYWKTDIAYCPTHWMPLPTAPQSHKD